jgi:polyisoprenoid-binding protein YceI
MNTSPSLVRRAAWLPAMIATLAGAAASAAPTTYAVDPAQSSLTFIATQQGEKFTGTIKSLRASVRYSPTELAASSLDVSMDLKSIDTRSGERDAALATAVWFDYAHTPIATFKSVGPLRQTRDGAVADADLVIKGRTKRITFPFRFAASGAMATLDARVTLDRLDFGLGAGEWADDSVIGHKVDVVVHLVLKATAN